MSEKNAKAKREEHVTANSFIPAVSEIMDAVRRKFGIREWVKRSAPERIHCHIKGYEDNYVVLPKEWLGKHLIKRDEIVAGMRGTPLEDNEDMRRLAISLGLVDDIHIPDLVGEGLEMDITSVPLPVLSWIVDAVFADFLAATFVPKAE